jgi:hypothetical protein
MKFQSNSDVLWRACIAALFLMLVGLWLCGEHSLDVKYREVTQNAERDVREQFAKWTATTIGPDGVSLRDWKGAQADILWIQHEKDYYASAERPGSDIVRSLADAGRTDLITQFNVPRQPG